MPLKYQEQLARRQDQPCPCTTKFQPRRVTAFRILRNACTEADFVPNAVMHGESPKVTCGHYALSFFDSLENAREQYLSLSKRIDVASIFGDHIGRIALVEADGVISTPNRKGHMDLHENVGASFVARVDEYFQAREGGRNAT